MSLGDDITQPVRCREIPTGFYLKTIKNKIKMNDLLTILGYVVICCVSFALLVGGIYAFCTTIRDMILNE